MPLLLPAACIMAAAWVGVDLAHSGGWFSAVAAWVALASAAAIGRWPERRRAAWLMFLWVLAGTLQGAGGDWPDSRLATTVMLLGFALQPPLYAHVALAYPEGRVRDRLERAFLATAYTVSLLWELTPALFADSRAPSLIFVGRWSLLEPLGYVYWSLFVVLGLVFVALVVRRVRRAPRGARRTLLPLTVAASFAAADFVLLRLAWITHWSAPLNVLGWLDDANTLVVPAALFLGMATVRRHRGPLGDLVVELLSARPDDIEGALARAVGDPSLQLLLSGESRRPDGRAVTPVGSRALLVHDPRLAGQRELLEAAGSAALLALERARPAAAPLEDLTAREREVLSLVAEGLTDRGIGERLWLTPKTVETHVRHILAKLRLPADARHNRRVLAARAYPGSRDAGDHGEEHPG